MKKIFTFLFAIVATSTLWAHDFEVDGIYYNILSDTTVEVTYRGSQYDLYDEYSGAVTIPAIVTNNGNTYRVIQIGERAFQQCSTLTRVTIGNNVKTIRESAFNGCSSLNSVSIPNSVKYIEFCAFLGCSGLTSIIIPNSVTSIGGEAFGSCIGLTSVTIPNSVINIGNSFSNCPNITSIVVENGNTKYDSRDNCNAIIETSTNRLIQGCQTTVIPHNTSSIGYSAFSGCSSLTSITIPNSVTSILTSAFSGCTSLTSITIPNSVTSIGSSTFYNCRNLKSITLPKNITSIESSTFYHCLALESIIIPEAVTGIKESAFWGCSSLTSITIPEGVDIINSRTFGRCNSLKSVTIPQSVIKIGDNAFENCTSLTKTNYLGDIASWCNIQFVDYDSNPIYYSHNIYINDVEITELVIPYGVTSIRDHAFNGCSNFTSATIPNSVTSIGRFAFSGCTGLTSIDIPNSVTSIDNSAFNGCSSLTSILIPNGITSIGNSTFFKCSSLTSIIIPSSVKSIKESAFSYCSALLSIVIPNSVTDIGRNAFADCSSLNSICISDSITFIRERTFSGCSALDSVIIPNNVTSIESNAFNNCDSLKSIKIGRNVTTIGYWAFGGCRALKSVTIPSKVTRLEDYAFVNCYALETIIVESHIPPTLGYHSIGTNNLCYVPCGTVEAYKASDWNKYCKAFIEPASDIQFNISVSDSTQGRIIIDQQPTCSNDTLIFHAEPIPSHYFVQWSDGNTDNPRTIILTQDTALAAEFAIKTCTLELSAEGNGTVTGAGTYNYGDTAIITARPEEHHHFVQWSDGNTDTLRTIVLTQDTSITARFAIDTYTLYLYTGENGIVTGAGTYNHGDTATITAIPNDGYYFTQWSDGNTDNPRTIIVTEDVFLSANFIIGGQCGDSLYWTYEQSTKQLTLLGTGDMYDYTVWTLPWQKYTHMIRSISLPEGMTTIGTSAFADCKYIHSIVIPSSVERINDSAFENCRMLSEIQFGEDGVLTELGSWAFYNCHELKELAIPEGVTSIGYATFYGCTYLNELTLPATMEYIADNGFAYCAKLQKMTVNAITPPQVDARTFEDVDRSIPVYVPAESVDAYKAAPVWQEFNIQSKSTNVENTADTLSFDAQKLIRNGQVYILHEEKQYTISGQLVK